MASLATVQVRQAIVSNNEQTETRLCSSRHVDGLYSDILRRTHIVYCKVAVREEPRKRTWRPTRVCSYLAILDERMIVLIDSNLVDLGLSLNSHCQQ